MAGIHIQDHLKCSLKKSRSDLCLSLYSLVVYRRYSYYSQSTFVFKAVLSTDLRFANNQKAALSILRQNLRRS